MIQETVITFSSPAVVPFSSNFLPALTCCNGTLYAVFVGTEHDAINIIASSDGIHWGTAQHISKYQTADRPALGYIPAAGEMFCAFRGISGGEHIWLTAGKSGNWGSLYNPLGNTSSLGPSLAYWEANQTLYCVFQAADASNNIRYISSTNGTDWSPYPAAYAGYATLDVPVFCGYGDTLYCAYKAGDNKSLMLISSADGVNWGSPVSLGETRNAPALCVAGGQLWCAYRAYNSDQVMLGCISTGGPGSWKFFNPQGITSGQGPVLCTTPDYGGTEQLTLLYISDGAGSPLMQIVQEMEG
jgi:hypothetical protein